MKALIDGDVIMYAAGFASDAAAKKEGHSNEPIEYALHGVKTMLEGIKTTVGADEPSVIYLSHPVNRRESIYPPYKMNRNVDHKPYWYDEIKEYLLDTQGALFSDPGDEADDALGIAAGKSDSVVVCSIDKDLDMIPGLHYNWSKTRRENGVYEASDPECLRIFYTQMLTGDTTDNIPGMFHTLGIKATARHKMPIETMTSAKEMYEYVLSVYGEKRRDHLDMLGQLLWIKRDEREWIAPR